MPPIKDIVDRVSRAFGPNADPAQVEAVVSSLLESGGPAPVLPGARLHVSLSDCSSLLVKTVRSRGYDKIRRIASHAESTFSEAGLSGSLQISTTPLTQIAGRPSSSDMVLLGRMLDEVSRDCSASQITGMTAGVQRGTAPANDVLLAAIPEILHTTQRVVIEVRAASPEAGVSVDAVMKLIAAARRYGGETVDLLRLRTTSGHPPNRSTADAALRLRADASVLIDEALRAAPDAAIHELAAVLKATAFGIGRAAAHKGDSAAAALSARSGLNVRYDGVDVDPGIVSPTDSVVREAYARAIADGFGAAGYGADILPHRVAVVFSATTTDGGAAAWLASRLADSGRRTVAVHTLFSQEEMGNPMRVGPFHHLKTIEPAEPEWVRRGGQIPASR